MISYEQHEPSIPDENIKLYVDFLNRYMNCSCDFELTDSNECDVYLFDYDFRFHMSSNRGEIVFLKVIFEKRNLEFNSLEEFDKTIHKFNSKFSAQISYKFKTTKRWFFGKNKFIPDLYLFEYKSITSKNEELVSEAIQNFYDNLSAFYKLDFFSSLMPKANFQEEEGKNFLTYLNDGVLLWKFLNEHPDLKEKYLTKLNL